MITLKGCTLAGHPVRVYDGATLLGMTDGEREDRRLYLPSSADRRAVTGLHSFTAKDTKRKYDECSVQRDDPVVKGGRRQDSSTNSRIPWSGAGNRTRSDRLRAGSDCVNSFSASIVEPPPRLGAKRRGSGRSTNTLSGQAPLPSMLMAIPFLDQHAPVAHLPDLRVGDCRI